MRNVLLWLCTALVAGTIPALAEDTMTAQHPTTIQTQTATFAGGCFWCMQPAFDDLNGVVSTTVGYAGGTELNPTYEQVSSGHTGHAESIEVVYDPSVITYERLLDVFWHNVNPTTSNRQFADVGRQYRTAIFSHDDEQQRLAKASRDRLAQSGKFQEPIVTEMMPATRFYPAEEYHQHYYKKNAIRYQLYRIGSGRAAYLEQTWGQRAH